MAITTIYSSSPNHSPTLLPTVSFPSISSLKSTSSLQIPFTLSSSSSSSSSLSFKFGSDTSIVIPIATDESVAVEWSRMMIGEVSLVNKENGDGVGLRREKRRKRRKVLYDLGDDNSNGDDVLFVDSKCMLLTSREEGEHALCIKELKSLEAMGRVVTEAGEPDVSSNSWAKTVGMNQRNLDRKLCRGRESRERICRIYKRLVVSVANGYQGKGLSMQDLIQEGSIGLLRGVEKFDPGRGYKLSTYVYYWIRQAITRAIANKSRVVRLPGRMCEILAKVAETNNVLSKKLGRLATYDEIAEKLDVKVSTVRLVSERSRPPISLDCVVTNRGCLTLQDIIAGPDEIMPETMMKKQLKKQVLEKIIKTVLSEREANVIRLYFGLNGETPRSCEDVGRLLKLSRERVRQINVTALSKLRQTSIVENLKMYML